MKIAVCDDDKAAREHIVSLIKEQIQDAEIVTFENGEEMLKAQEDFDISILDVEMEKLSGMDVANHIRQEQEEKGSARSIIIFVTGHDKYMNDAFDVSAFHYLLKSLNEEKFRTVLGRALKELAAAKERIKRCILVKNPGVQQKVYIKDIYYIESANKKVIIHTTTGMLECYGKMEELEQVTGSNFYRCHRCYIVNMEKIVSYSADSIKVVNGDELILAQKKFNDFIRQYVRSLQMQYNYFNAKGLASGVPTTVNVPLSLLQECMNDPEIAANLEKSLKQIPNLVNYSKSIAGSCGCKITDKVYMVGADGNLSGVITTCAGANDSSASENIERKADGERIARKKAVEKEQKERLAKQREERNAEKEAVMEAIREAAQSQEFTFFAKDAINFREKLMEIMENPLDSTALVSGLVGFDMQA